jgi:predicted patatin/cPLA2 family phospholipase
MADRKVYKQKKRTTESDKLVEESIERFNELTNAIQSRQDQYRAVSRYVE